MTSSGVAMPSAPRQLADDDLGHQDPRPLAGAAELADVGAEVVALDDARERPTLPQRYDVPGRADAPQRAHGADLLTGERSVTAPSCPGRVGPLPRLVTPSCGRGRNWSSAFRREEARTMTSTISRPITHHPTDLGRGLAPHPVRRGPRPHRGPRRAAVPGGPDGPVDARRLPDEVAPRPRDLVLRDLRARRARARLRARSRTSTGSSSTATTRRSGRATRAPSAA